MMGFPDPHWPLPVHHADRCRDSRRAPNAGCLSSTAQARAAATLSPRIADAFTGAAQVGARRAEAGDATLMSLRFNYH